MSFIKEWMSRKDGDSGSIKRFPSFNDFSSQASDDLAQQEKDMQSTVTGVQAILHCIDLNFDCHFILWLHMEGITGSPLLESFASSCAHHDIIDERFPHLAPELALI